MGAVLVAVAGVAEATTGGGGIDDVIEGLSFFSFFSFFSDLVEVVMTLLEDGELLPERWSGTAVLLPSSNYRYYALGCGKIKRRPQEIQHELSESSGTNSMVNAVY